MLGLVKLLGCSLVDGFGHDPEIRPVPQPGVELVVVGLEEALLGSGVLIGKPASPP